MTSHPLRSASARQSRNWSSSDEADYLSVLLRRLMVILLVINRDLPAPSRVRELYPLAPPSTQTPASHTFHCKSPRDGVLPTLIEIPQVGLACAQLIRQVVRIGLIRALVE